MPELDRLRRLVVRGGVGHAARELGRSEDSVRRRLAGLRPAAAARQGSSPWTEEESRLLREAWGALDPGELAMLLHRPEPEVLAQAERLRRQVRHGPWTGEELRNLRRTYGTRSDADLEVVLGRTQKEIQQQAERLCLAKDRRFPSGSGRRMPRWTPQEVERLRAIYPHRDNLDVARELGRSVASVANKANQLGLHKSPEILAQLGRRNVARRHKPAGAAPEAPASAAPPQGAHSPAAPHHGSAAELHADGVGNSRTEGPSAHTNGRVDARSHPGGAAPGGSIGQVSREVPRGADPMAGPGEVGRAGPGG